MRLAAPRSERSSAASISDRATWNLDAWVLREREGVELPVVPGQRVVSPFGEPPLPGVEAVAVVVDPVGVVCRPCPADGGPRT